MQNLRRSFLIAPPRMDGSDSSRFFTDIARHCHDNVAEARAFERQIADTLAPMARQLAFKLKDLRMSAHQRRWRNLYD